MLKIRLMRIGTKKKPFYRVVAVDERAKRTGAYIELLGTYNPLTEPKDIQLKKDRIDYWIKQGAQPSVGYLRIIGKAPQRPPRKPKKEKLPKEVEVLKVSEKAETEKSEKSAESEDQVTDKPEKSDKSESEETSDAPISSEKTEESSNA